MEKIQPKKRYSQSLTKRSKQHKNIIQIAKGFGFNSKELSVESLTGGFMNSNYLVQDANNKAVLRASATNEETTRKEGALLNLVRSKGVKAPKFLDIQAQPRWVQYSVEV